MHYVSITPQLRKHCCQLITNDTWGGGNGWREEGKEHSQLYLWWNGTINKEFENELVRATDANINKVQK